jgi:hypothetical protein
MDHSEKFHFEQAQPVVSIRHAVVPQRHPPSRRPRLRPENHRGRVRDHYGPGFAVRGRLKRASAFRRAGQRDRVGFMLSICLASNARADARRESEEFLTDARASFFGKN